jgi:hypothetical protein
MSLSRKTPNEILFAQASPDKVMPIFYLWRGIWRFIFDEKGCPFGFRKELETEILKWDRIIKYQKKIRHEKYGPTPSDNAPVGKKGNVIDEFEYQIGLMCKHLVDNEAGYWDYHKDTLRIHNIDYRKSIHCQNWFPEFEIDFKKGQAALEQAKRDNPQDYLENGNADITGRI